MNDFLAIVGEAPMRGKTVQADGTEEGTTTQTVLANAAIAAALSTDDAAAEGG